MIDIENVAPADRDPVELELFGNPGAMTSNETRAATTALVAGNHTSMRRPKMTSFSLNIHTISAAFDDDNRGPELARILRALADKLHNNTLSEGAGRLLDINGNVVGVYYGAVRVNNETA